MTVSKTGKPKEKQRTMSIPYGPTEAERLERVRKHFEKELNIRVNATDAFRLLLARYDKHITGGGL